ncbi:MAG: glycine oxidase [Cryomorphaceae bacterium]|jgi:glycine oxidase
MKVDFLIIGQGLAGSALAMALIDRGATIMVIDSEDENSASRVAAGLVTTVAGKGMNLSWRQGEYLPEAIAYYRNLEEASGKALFHSLDTLRLFDSEKQRDKFDHKRGQLYGWVGDADPDDLSKWNTEYGGFIMTQGGWLDTKTYLQVIRETLGDRYRSDSFQESDLAISDGEVNWKDITAKRIILCQGSRGFTEEGLFSFLNHRCAKGEILTVSIPNASQEKIINNNGWLIPLGNETWRAGATYEWDDMSGVTSEAGRSEIEEKILNLTDLPFQVIEHSAGVRPILRKSQPYIGHHPDHPEVSLFNGLGSKGVTTAPSVAAHFSEHLVTGEVLDISLTL